MVFPHGISRIASSFYRFDELFFSHHSFVANIKELYVGTSLSLFNFDDK